MDKFTEARRTYEKLNNQYAAGNLDKEAFQQAVDILAFQDQFGFWWQIGIVSGKWYRFDGSQWLEDYPPPPDLELSAAPPAISKPAAPAPVKAPATLRWGLIVPGKADPFPLADGITIGRADACDLTLADGKASRQHARIERRRESFWIVDLNSSNGVFVNDERIGTAVQLKSGDQIRIGDSVISVVGPTSPAMAVATIVDQEPLSVQAPVQPVKQAPPVANNTLVCQKCQQPLNPGAKFCRACGTPVSQIHPAQAPAQPAANICQQCGNPLSPNAKFCAKCGTTVVG